jgi:hypothetical protein
MSWTECLCPLKGLKISIVYEENRKLTFLCTIKLSFDLINIFYLIIVWGRLIQYRKSKHTTWNWFHETSKLKHLFVVKLRLCMYVNMKFVQNVYSNYYLFWRIGKQNSRLFISAQNNCAGQETFFIFRRVDLLCSLYICSGFQCV